MNRSGQSSRASFDCPLIPPPPPAAPRSASGRTPASPPSRWGRRPIRRVLVLHQRHHADLRVLYGANAANQAWSRISYARCSDLIIFPFTCATWAVPVFPPTAIPGSLAIPAVP